MIKKQRNARSDGELNGMSKFSEEIITRVVNLFLGGSDPKTISELLNISHGHTGDILRRYRWALPVRYYEGYLNRDNSFEVHRNGGE